MLICLNFLVAYKFPSGKVYLYPSLPSYPWHILIHGKWSLRNFWMSEYWQPLSFPFCCDLDASALQRVHELKLCSSVVKCGGSRSFMRCGPEVSQHIIIFSSFWAIVTSEPLFHHLTPSFLLCCTQRALTKTRKCQAHASETPKLWEKEMHLLYKVYSTKYFVAVMENRLILLTLSRGLFCQWAILDSGGWQDHVVNYCNWICRKRFFGLEKGLFI